LTETENEGNKPDCLSTTNVAVVEEIYCNGCYCWRCWLFSAV